MPEPTDDLRVRIARALADHEQADRGLDTDHYPPERWLCCADAVIAALDEPEPDDLDQFIREQAANDPRFAAEYVQAQHAATARAHAAEKTLAVRARNRWSASADVVVVVPCVFAAAGLAALVQWLTGSELAGNACAIASLAVTTPVGVRIERAWRRAAR